MRGIVATLLLVSAAGVARADVCYEDDGRANCNVSWLDEFAYSKSLLRDDPAELLRMALGPVWRLGPRAKLGGQTIAEVFLARDGTQLRHGARLRYTWPVYPHVELRTGVGALHDVLSHAVTGTSDAVLYYGQVGAGLRLDVSTDEAIRLFGSLEFRETPAIVVGCVASTVLGVLLLAAQTAD